MKFSCSPWEPGSLKHIRLQLVRFLYPGHEYALFMDRASSVSLCSLSALLFFNPEAQEITMQNTIPVAPLLCNYRKKCKGLRNNTFGVEQLAL